MKINLGWLSGEWWLKLFSWQSLTWNSIGYIWEATFFIFESFQRLTTYIDCLKFINDFETSFTICINAFELWIREEHPVTSTVLRKITLGSTSCFQSNRQFHHRYQQEVFHSFFLSSDRKDYLENLWKSVSKSRETPIQSQMLFENVPSARAT